MWRYLLFSLVFSGAAIASSPGEELPLLPMPYGEKGAGLVFDSQDWQDQSGMCYTAGQKQVCTHGAGQPVLVCSILDLCVIELQEGEKVSKSGIQLGDSVRWGITPTTSGKKTLLVVKPKEVDLETTLVVATDKRWYHVALRSHDTDYMAGLAFEYPDEQEAAWEAYQAEQAKVQEKEAKQQEAATVLPDTGQSLAALDFAYSVVGDDWFKPIRVYNDGRRTYVQLPDMTGREMPALLVVGAQGEQLVNYRTATDKYIVDQLFSEAVLVMGVGKQQSRVTIRYTGGA